MNTCQHTHASLVMVSSQVFSRHTHTQSDFEWFLDDRSLLQHSQRGCSRQVVAHGRLQVY